MRRQKSHIEGKTQHARRVAAWSSAVARSHGFSAGEQAALQEAALSHQLSPILLDETALTRMLVDLGVEVSGPSMISAEARRVLKARGAKTSRGRGLDELKRSDPGINRSARLAAILEQCDSFDEHFEIEPFLDAQEPPPAEAMHALQEPHQSEIAAVKDRMPVFPAAAQAALGLLGRADIDVDDLYKVARTDQVLAASVIEAANSALWGGSQTIRDLMQALLRVGIENAKKALLMGALRPMFSSPALRRAWQHAQDAADAAERIAALTRKIPPQQAFLAGLVHDIGELRFQLASRSTVDERRGLVAQGCPPRVVEQIVFATDHATAGAELLLGWRFPQEFCDAVACHHCPERTELPLAALLYLVEFELCSEEDLPSLARLRAACRRLNVSWSKGRFRGIIER